MYIKHEGPVYVCLSAADFRLLCGWFSRLILATDFSLTVHQRGFLNAFALAAKAAGECLCVCKKPMGIRLMRRLQSIWSVQTVEKWLGCEKQRGSLLISQLVPTENIRKVIVYDRQVARSIAAVLLLRFCTVDSRFHRSWFCVHSLSSVDSPCYLFFRQQPSLNISRECPVPQCWNCTVVFGEEKYAHQIYWTIKVHTALPQTTPRALNGHVCPFKCTQSVNQTCVNNCGTKSHGWQHHHHLFLESGRHL